LNSFPYTPIWREVNHHGFENHPNEVDRMLTNFGNDELPRYKKAIELFEKKYGDRGFHISDKACDCCRSPLKGYSSLHYVGKVKDLSHFWEIFDSLE
jgi:hypothetical protein